MPIRYVLFETKELGGHEQVIIPGVTDTWRHFEMNDVRDVINNNAQILDDAINNPPAGAQGVQGTIGNNGSIGDQGARGAQGYQGINSSVRGYQGLPGAQGNRGVQGVAGAQGPQGVQGMLGMQGYQGAQGPQGTNVTTRHVWVGWKTIRFITDSGNVDYNLEVLNQ